MTSKLVVNTIEADTGISSVSFASSISMSSTSKFHFGNAGIDIGADTNINRPEAGVLGFNINSGEKVRIESGGDVGINTSNPTVKLDISEDKVAFPSAAGSTLLRLRNSAGSATLSIDANAGNASAIQFGDTAAASQGAVIYNHSSNHLQFNTSGGERLRIDSSGHISQGGGATPSSTNGGIGLKYGIKSAANNIIIGETTSSSHNGLIIESRQTGRSGGARCSQIIMGDGVINFETAASGADVTQRLRITSDGYLKLGSTDGGAWHTIRLNTTTNNAIKDVLHVHSSVDSGTAAAGFGVRLNFIGEQLNGNEYIYGGIAGLLSGTGSNYGDLAFYTNNNGTNTERLRIDSSGKSVFKKAAGATNNAYSIVTEFNAQTSGSTAANFGPALYLSHTFGGTNYAGSLITSQTDADVNTTHISFFPRNYGWTEALRITKDGILETGTAAGASGADGNQRLRVGRAGDCNIAVRATASTTASTGLDFGDQDDDRAGRIQYNHQNNYMSFHTNGAGSGASNEKLRITSSGHVQTFTNPSFRAGLNSNTTFNQSTNIIFNDTSATWHYNRGNHYSTSNGRFTAPVEGVYQFNACIIWYGAPNNTFMGDSFHFYVNNGNACYSGRRGYYNTGTTGNNLYYTDHMSVNLYLNATDYVNIRQSSPVTTVHGNTYYTWFAGSFLG